MALRFESVATGVVLIAAVSVAAVNIHREFFSRVLPGSRGFIEPPRLVEGWEKMQAIGDIVGDSTASIKIIEFADFECPVCRRFHTSLQELRRAKGRDVALIFVHYPLPQHRFALPAARASECARAQGRFGEFVDVLYAKQDSLGLKSWASYAYEAGIRDTQSVAQCANSPRPNAKIDAGLALGKSIGIEGTPTVIINGWRLGAAPFDSLAAVVDNITLHRQPFVVRASAK